VGSDLQFSRENRTLSITSAKLKNNPNSFRLQLVMIALPARATDR